MSQIPENGTDVHAASAWMSPVSYWMPSHIVESAWLRHGAFAAWLMSALRPRTLLELGTHNGFSYFAFVEAARRLGLDLRSWAIDTWEGDEHAGFYDDEIFRLVTATNEPYVPQSTLLRGYFADQVGVFEDGSIDLLHIDGRHRYEDAREDFELYLPKVSERGVVLFHDIAETENGFGVYRLWAEVSERYPSFAFEHEHGLGVLAVGSHVADGIAAFLDSSRDHAAEIRDDYVRLGAEISAQRDRQRMLRDAMTRVAVLDAEKAQLEGQVQEMRNSRSWRVTAPLRRLRDRRV